MMRNNVTKKAHEIRTNPVSSKQEKPRPLMRELSPATPFPVEALGSVLENAATAINDKVQAPLATCGQAVLAVATLATQDAANVILPTGQAKPLSCYFQTILETGGRKTACDTEASKPIRTYEDSLREKYESEMPGHLNDKSAYEEAQKFILKKHKGNRQDIKKALDALGEAPKPPLHYMLTSTEPTFEGLCYHFNIGHPSLGIFATEGGQFVGGHSMNEEAKLRTATGLSNLWDGEAIRRVRRGDGVQEFRNKRLAIHLQVQPDVASIMLTDRLLIAQGLNSRFLVTAPDSLAGTRLWKEASAGSDMQAYNDHIKTLLGQKPVGDFRDLPLSIGARTIWITFADHVERDLLPGGDMEPIAGLANKLPEHAARLAAILTLVENIDAGEISGHQMAAGIELAKHYAAEAIRLFGASAIHTDLILAQRLSAWLRGVWKERETNGLVSLPDIYQRAPITAIRDMSSARRIMSVLEAHGHVIEKGSGEVAGEKRRETWMVVPEEGL